LTSKIINMAEKLKDAEDRLLESMFAAQPIADDGFSHRVVTRIRRRIWLRRLALPVAMLIGGAIAIKPASELVIAASKLLAVVPQGLIEAPVSWLPEVQGAAIGAPLVQTVVFGVVLLALGIFGSRIILD
jgi:hypothetical protein